MNASEKIDISNVLKARKVFESFRKDMKTDRDKAGAVKAFEFSYELSWKVMRRVLESRGLEVGSPKDTFRKAALEKLIDDPEIWFAFQKMRDLTVHTYNKEDLEIVVSVFDVFSKELNTLIDRLQNLI
ncbi:MAG: nucleotidyltransferase substrate binding protein [Alphaproteobacteria bacterium]|nr:nucleotidyltransferase substrate binding protein [Alphaproteobacteria bacterium]